MNEERRRETHVGGREGLRVKLFQRSIDFIEVVMEQLVVGLCFDDQLTLMNDVESKRPSTVGQMKGVLHAVDQHGDVEAKFLLALTGVVQTLFDRRRLIHTRYRFPNWPLILGMSFSDVDGQASQTFGSIRANERAKRSKSMTLRSSNPTRSLILTSFAQRNPEMEVSSSNQR